MHIRPVCLHPFLEALPGKIKRAVGNHIAAIVERHRPSLLQRIADSIAAVSNLADSVGINVPEQVIVYVKGGFSFVTFIEVK